MRAACIRADAAALSDASSCWDMRCRIARNSPPPKSARMDRKTPTYHAVRRSRRRASEGIRAGSRPEAIARAARRPDQLRLEAVVDLAPRAIASGREPALMHSLARLRLRLTAWYVGVFLSILALLGGGLFLAIRHRMSQQLDASLRAAASALMQAARIREAELAGAKGVVADAVDELHIPDRALYLFGAGATPIKPAEAPDWIREAAREAERAGAAHRDLEREDHIVRLYAERFGGANGRVYVATAVADRLELEHEYASLIRAFAAAALAALLLAARGGYLPNRHAAPPLERSV